MASPDRQQREYPAFPGLKPAGLLAITVSRWRMLFALVTIAFVVSMVQLSGYVGRNPTHAAPPSVVHALTPAPRKFKTLGERGEYLYSANGCFGCHGSVQTAALVNPNSQLGHVPTLDHLAPHMLLFEPSSIAWVVQRIKAGESVVAASYARPPFRNYARFVVVYQMYRELIQKGSPSHSLDAGSPSPPLNMPPWAGHLVERDIDALLVYLLLLSDEDADDD